MQVFCHAARHFLQEKEMEEDHAKASQEARNSATQLVAKHRCGML